MESFRDTLTHKLSELTYTARLKSPQEVLTVSRAKLMMQGHSGEDIQVLKELAAKVVAKTAVPVADLLKAPWAAQWSRLSFGCTALDGCMCGGVLTRGITEICGKAGTGKTQLLLQLSLTTQLPTDLGGLGKRVAYIFTEGAFPTKRLFQIANAFSARYPEQKINYLDNVLVEHVLESKDLLAAVCVRLARVMETSNIGLIVIDSVAAVFRTGFKNYVQRARDMRKLAVALLHYANKYNCAVVCVNQVASVVNKTAGEVEVPCLGLAWAHLGRTRIRISRVPKQVRINNVMHMVRKFEVMNSPDTPSDFTEFLITETGIVDL